jgi:hypothetical protein
MHAIPPEFLESAPNAQEKWFSQGNPAIPTGLLMETEFDYFSENRS